MSEISIKKIKVRDLPEFARQLSQYPLPGVIPINKTRARAMALNPHAGQDDIGLIAAYINGNCVGYIGIMPALLKTHENFSKVYWFSTFFVSSGYRGKGIGRKLAREAFTLSYDILACPAAGSSSDRVFEQASMARFASLDYFSIDLRALNPVSALLRLLRAACRKLRLEPKLLAGAITAADSLLAPLITFISYRLLLPAKLKKRESFSRHEQDLAPEEISRHARSAFDFEFYRGPETLSWMLSHNWMAQRCSADPMDKKYFFSGVTGDFDYHAFRLQDGFLILSLRREPGASTVKVLDLYPGKTDPVDIAAIIWGFASREKATRVEFEADISGTVGPGTWLKRLANKKKLSFLYHPGSSESPLARSINNIRVKFCDGDNAFF